MQGNGHTTTNLHVVDGHINIFNDSVPRKYLRRRHLNESNEARENIPQSVTKEIQINGKLKRERTPAYTSCTSAFVVCLLRHLTYSFSGSCPVGKLKVQITREYTNEHPSHLRNLWICSSVLIKSGDGEGVEGAVLPIRSRSRSASAFLTLTGSSS